jgi:hypothetical protein
MIACIVNGTVGKIKKEEFAKERNEGVINNDRTDSASRINIIIGESGNNQENEHKMNGADCGLSRTRKERPS